LVPKDIVQYYVRYYLNGQIYAALGTLDTSQQTLENISLTQAFKVQGQVTHAVGNDTEIYAAANVSFESDDCVVRQVTNGDGNYSAYLPAGTYNVWSTTPSSVNAKAFIGECSVTADTTYDIVLEDAIAVSGDTYFDYNDDDLAGVLEKIENIQMEFSYSTGPGVLKAFSNRDGIYYTMLPVNRTYNVLASKSGYADVTGTMTPSSTNDTFKVEFDPNQVQVSGIVQYAGLPSSTQTVLFTNSLDETFSTVTGAIGEYTITLDPNSYDVEVNWGVSTDLKRQFSDEIDLAIGSPTFTLDMDLEDRYRLSGGFNNIENASNDMSLIIQNYTTGWSIEPDVVGGNFTTYLPNGGHDLAATENGDDGAVNVMYKHIEMNGIADMTLSLASAVETTVTIQNLASSLNKLPFIITKPDGLRMNTTYTRGGANSFSAEDGTTYTATVDYKPDELANGKYVHYTSTRTFNPIGQDYSLVITLATTELRANIIGTVSANGTGAAGVVEFIPDVGNKITATADAAGLYTAQLKSGTFEVYAVSGENVFIGTFTVGAEDTNSGIAIPFDISTSQGAELRGRVYYNNMSGTRNNANNGTITLSSELISEKTVTTDAGGDYSVYLPVGEYSISCSVDHDEFNITNSYANATQEWLNASTVLDLQLEMANILTAEVELINGTTKTLDPGASTTFQLLVTNTGNRENSFNLTGSLAGWNYTFSANNFTLALGKNRTVDVAVMTADDAKVNYGTASVSVISNIDNVAKDNVALDIDINHIPGVDLNTSYATSIFDTDMNQLTHPIRVLNTGNDEDMINISLINRNELLTNGWNVSIQVGGSEVNNVTVAAGGETQVNLIITQVEGVAPVPVNVRVWAVSSVPGTSDTRDFKFTVPDIELDTAEIDVSGEDVFYEDMASEYLIYTVLVLIILVAMFSMMMLGRSAKPAKGRKKRRLNK
jgi:hypothetical protein